MQRVTQDGLVYYQFGQFQPYPDLVHGVFTRLGGTSHEPFDSLNVGMTVGDDMANVQANRGRMARSLGIRDKDVRSTWQVHGADVVVVRDRSAQSWPLPQADGIITQERNLPLAMRFADCAPLVFFDPIQKVIGLAHAGWRGTLAGIGPATIKTMEGAFGSRPADICVGIGPAIGPCCYEVGPEVIDQFGEQFGTLEGLVHRHAKNDQRPHLDLWAANAIALRRAGVQQIEIAGICTASTTNEFFSHRAAGGKTGRFGVLIMLRGEEAS